MSFTKRFATAIAVAATAGSITASSLASAGETITYTYDALGRLVVAKSTGTVNNNQTHSICYDAAGNRILYDSNTTGTPPACVSSP
jgi:YD repeat-containing protein